MAERPVTEKESLHETAGTAWFTCGTLLIFLSLGKLPLKKWYRFVTPTLATLFVAACVMLAIAAKMNYGPF